MMRITHTYATLEISAAAYDEIALKLRAAGYVHAFHPGSSAIDMQGIGLLRGAHPIDERAQFEVWMRRENDYRVYKMKFGTFSSNVYDHPGVQDSWEAWQARAKINNDPEKIERLQRDCGEAYQVIGAGMLGIQCVFTQSDVARALDNLSAAANGEPRPHDDLLPWPKGAA